MSRKKNEVISEEELAIRQWRVRKLIKKLEQAKGNGTSMISLIIPPKDQISRYSKMLADEFGTASNIKSRVNKLSVLSAITSTQQKLKLYNQVPTNGLVVYAGTISLEDGKERKETIDFEPHKPINTSLYLCDNRFHTEPLKELLEADEKYGFIVMDGQGTLFGTLSGNTKSILQKISVDLPKKHGRGGQSAVRFARLRVEKRRNYVRKVSELAVQHFVTNDKPNVSGLVLAGLAEFKNKLALSDLFDGRLKRIILKIVDVSYGGENGFNQAIEQSSDTLRNVKFVAEQKLIAQFFEEIAKDTGKICYGIKETMAALEAGASTTLIIHDNLEMHRYLFKDRETGEQIEKFYNPEQEEKDANFKNKDGTNYDIISKEPIVEYFADNYKQWGTSLQFVTDRSQEGAQFVMGFGGIGALLRWKMNFDEIIEDDEDEVWEWDL